ncbi:hypothetical protein DID78_00690 [Candidatus Marinamargulisbacteria bacterium SCGC AG-343-D04]|nr:hypothetical protein DID78_00690 [Candidatus Marinamargulisbacteria bacterium SCGC AG-343-D04]
MISVLFLSLFLFSCKSPEIKTYHTPKERLKVAVLHKEKELSWTIPDHWQKKELTSFRKASFTIPGPSTDLSADFSITSFPGSAGNLLSNINRWRHQLELEPLDYQTMNSSLSTISHSHLDIQFIELKSEKSLLNNSHFKSTFVAFFIFNDETYFFKLTGESLLLDKEKMLFKNILESLQ